MTPPPVTVRPIDAWTDPPTTPRRSAPFKASESATMALLTHELSMLGAKFGIVEVVMDGGGLRLDGQLRAKAEPTHPGVVLHLESKHGPLRYACDQFTHWRDNLRAIALGLEALRKVERYGIAKRGEQYRGWTQLPAAGQTQSADEARDVIRSYAGDEYAGAPLSRQIAAAQRHAHPDGGGDAEAFHAVQRAKRLLVGS